ncbi:MAG: hypothetical protein WBL44_16570 [Nitrososphaeraceae archaeon]|jgi:hypothetical protein
MSVRRGNILTGGSGRDTFFCVTVSDFVPVNGNCHLAAAVNMTSSTPLTTATSAEEYHGTTESMLTTTLQASNPMTSLPLSLSIQLSYKVGGSIPQHTEGSNPKMAVPPSFLSPQARTHSLQHLSLIILRPGNLIEKPGVREKNLD